MESRKTIKHKVYTIEEKNRLVEVYHQSYLSKPQFIEQYEIRTESVDNTSESIWHND
jgi:hypothetical protein